MPTFWVTKYALTTGIFQVDGRVSSNSDTMIVWEDGKGHSLYAHGKDWHHTYQAARDQAKQMREAKIASLKKQISKLDKMRF